MSGNDGISTDTRHRRFDQRDSGIPLVDTLPWGSHFCVLYDGSEMLFELVIPYLAAGLRGNEHCLWAVKDASDVDTAVASMAALFPDTAEYRKSGQLAIIPESELDRSDKALAKKLDAAVAQGWDGIRIAAESASGKGPGGSTEFLGGGLMNNRNIIMACLYPRAGFDALGLMDVVKGHSFALLRDDSQWEIVESSEARMAREALRRSEEKLQSLFGSMSEGFAYHRMVLDDIGEPVDYVFLEVNKAFEDLTGLKGEDIIGIKATEVLPGIEKDPTDWIGRYGRVALTGEPSRFESYSQPLDRWYSVSAFSSHKGFFGATFTDITARKRAEQALREREVELTSIYENAPILMLLVDKERRVRKANRSVLEFTGVDFTEISGMRAGEALGCLNSQDDPDGCGFGPHCQACPVRLAISRIFRSGEGTYQIEATRPLLIEGETADVTFLLSVAPVSVLGEPRALLTIQDISDRKQAEESIGRQNELLEAINQIMRFALTANSQEQLAEECLNLAEEITGGAFGFIGLIGSDGLLHDVAVSNPGWYACVMYDQSGHRRPPGDFKIHGMYGKVLLDGEALIVNDPAAHPDSIGTPERHPLLSSFLGVPLKRGEETIGMIAVANREGGFEDDQKDVLEVLAPAIKEALGRKRTEVELKRTMIKLEQSNEELQQFAYVASHDLQEPLRMVASFLQLLWQRYASSLDEDAREFIDYAVDGANHMQVMINDLLMFSRVGNQSGEFGTVNMEQVLANVENNLKIAIEEKGAEISSGELPVIEADTSMVTQLLQNLVSNAIKFGGDRPEIRIEAEKHEDEWLFSVKDNGIGIEPEFQQRIFIIFQRLHAKAEYPGTGIGLAVCKRIIERHRGRIWVESIPGEGSQFFFTVPLEQSV